MVQLGMPAAQLFVGPAPQVRAQALALFSKHLCAQLNTTPDSNAVACGTCAPCIKIKNGNNTDLILIEPQDEQATKQITVENLRDLKMRLYFAPIESPYRLVVIADAPRLNSSASNALLKTLEEPPSHTKFILGARDKTQLLPTIVSRLRVVNLAPLNTNSLRDQLEKLCQDQNITTLSPDVSTLFLELAAGDSDRLNSLCSPEFIEILTIISKQGSPEATPSHARFVALADKLSAATSDLHHYIDAAFVHKHQLLTKALTQNSTTTDFWALSHSALKLLELKKVFERQGNKKLMAAALSENLQ